MSDRKTKVCLIIRDGWGKGKETESNAIFKAQTPFADDIENNYPTTLIATSGLEVGLPKGYQGNSEVGHLNIGAGRVVYQSLTRIDKAVQDGEFKNNLKLRESIKRVIENKKRLHVMGLIQEEGVHAVTRHAIEIVKLAHEMGLDKERIIIHAISDGRDTPPKSGKEHMQFLQTSLDKVGGAVISTLVGRYYSMDRDKRWDRTQKAYNAVVKGEGEKADSWQAALDKSYAENITDEFVTPFIFNDYKGIEDGDELIFFNFRFDRTRQLTQALCEKDFSDFPVQDLNINLLAMTHYYDNGNFEEMFPELQYANILGEVLEKEGMTQVRCAETEKYAHVTFFFNALRNEPFEGEERILVNSPKVATYDLQPEMSAWEVRDKLVEAVKSDKYDVIICNFANGDMVGHTGVKPAIIKAVETVDQCVQEICEEVMKKGGVSIITADHGNAEETELPDGSPMTSHTKNKVPLSIYTKDNFKLRDDGSLCDIAPTMLELLKIKQPKEMGGKSLILEKKN